MTSKARLPLSVPFFYGWVAVSLSFLSTLVGAGIRSAPTVFIHPLEMEFGWSRTAIAFGISVNLLLYGLAAPISGWLLDRFGPRRVMLGSLGFMAVGVGLTTFMQEYWHLVLGFKVAQDVERVPGALRVALVRVRRLVALTRRTRARGQRHEPGGDRIPVVHAQSAGEIRVVPREFRPRGGRPASRRRSNRHPDHGHVRRRV